jgi:hypothetical protein
LSSMNRTINNLFKSNSHPGSLLANKKALLLVRI